MKYWNSKYKLNDLEHNLASFQLNIYVSGDGTVDPCVEVKPDTYIPTEPKSKCYILTVPNEKPPVIVNTEAELPDRPVGTTEDVEKQDVEVDDK